MICDKTLADDMTLFKFHYLCEIAKQQTKYNMKITKFFSAAAAVLAIAALMTSCEEPVQNLGAPKLTLDTDELTFDAKGGDQTLTLNATRDWIFDDYMAYWVVVSPDNGEASADDQVITVTVLENKGMDREVDIVFTIGMAERTLTVKQAGPGGSESANIVYFNDLDKEEAVKGTNGWATYLDSFEGWKNAVGTGAANCGFSAKGITVRTNSGNGSAGKYSVYEGSGMNYLWFAKENHFAITNIALDPAKSNYTLSFGTERYEYGDNIDNTFKPEEFKVYVSADAKKWVEVKYTFPGALQNGKWDLASTTFTVPAGTKTLSLYFAATVASVYALDDVKLVVTNDEGTKIDFTGGVELDMAENTGGGNEGGGNEGGEETPAQPDAYPTAEPALTPITVKEFLAKPVSYTDWYQLTGKITKIEGAQYGNIYVEDETGSAYIYGVTSKWIGAKNDKSFESLNLNVGDIITIGTLRQAYNGSPQGGGSWCAAWYKSHVEGEAPVETADEVIAVADLITAMNLTADYNLPEGTPITLSKNLSVTYTKVNNTNSKLHYKDQGIRWYKGDIMKFTFGKAVAKIEFVTYGGSDYDGPLSADKGTMDTAGVVWTGNASEITFTAAQNQVRVSAIKVTYVK